MKKYIIALILLFIGYAIAVNTCPVIAQWDAAVIIMVQNFVKDLPVWIPLLPDAILYAILIAVPLIMGIVYFIRKYLLIDAILFVSAPAVAYVLNSIIKMIIHRPRPPFDLQIAIHPHTYSFVSRHTFITALLWGLVIYYVYKYCKNRMLKFILITFAILWILFVGFSRIWLGVHYPTDVLGGYFLATILLIVYIRLIKLIGGKC